MGHRKQGLAKELLPLQPTTHCHEASSGATVATHFPFYVQFSGPRPIPVAETLLYEIAPGPNPGSSLISEPTPLHRIEALHCKVN